MIAMAKQKTHKGLTKRVKITGTGKVKRRQAFHAHLMSGKPGTRRQRLRRQVIVKGRIADAVKRALGAG